VSERREELRIGFLSFGHWQRAQWSRTLTAKDALVQTVELAQAAEEIGIDGAFVRGVRRVRGRLARVQRVDAHAGRIAGESAAARGLTGRPIAVNLAGA
jgi:hypothetical protein